MVDRSTLFRGLLLSGVVPWLALPNTAEAFSTGTIASQPVPLFEAQTLTDPMALSGNAFGASCDMDGDRLVIGRTTYIDNQDQGLPGQARVFKRDSTSGLWDAGIDLPMSSGSARVDGFGRSVSLDGSVLAVGAPGELNGGGNKGAVYIYEYANEVWSEVQRITGTPTLARPEPPDEFGLDVALRGDELVVGAPGTGDEHGSVHYFQRDQGLPVGAQWVQVQEIVAFDRLPDDEFGVSVAIDGDFLLVGAYQDDDPVAGLNAGSAYLYRRIQAVGVNAPWVFLGPKLLAPAPATLGRFGQDVAIDGTNLVIGAPGMTLAPPALPSAGLSFVFTQGPPTGMPLVPPAWTLTATLSPSDAAGAGMFGSSVDIEANRILVGADGKGVPASGEAFLYQLDPALAGWSEMRKLTPLTQSAGDQFGWDVSLSGDSMVVAAPQFQSAPPGTGNAQTFDLSGNFNYLISFPPTLSAAAAPPVGTVSFVQDAGPANAFNYVHMLTDLCLDFANPWVASGFVLPIPFGVLTTIPQGSGFLDANGRRTGVVPLIVDPMIIGSTRYFGYFVFDPVGGFTVDVSETMAVTFIP